MLACSICDAQDIIKQYQQIARYAVAWADATEWAQIQAKQTANQQNYTILTLDLEKNGISLRAKPEAGMAINRNRDGIINQANELFSGAELSAEAQNRILQRLANKQAANTPLFKHAPALPLAA